MRRNGCQLNTVSEQMGHPVLNTYIQQISEAHSMPAWKRPQDSCALRMESGALNIPPARKICKTSNSLVMWFSRFHPLCKTFTWMQSSAQITNFDLNHVSKSNHQLWFKSKISAHKFSWSVQSQITITNHYKHHDTDLARSIWWRNEVDIPFIS